MGGDRKSLSYRVFKLESALFALCAIGLGIALVAVSQIPAIRRIEWMPLKELGFASLGTGVVSVVFEYISRRDWVHRIIEGVLRGFAASPNDLARFLSSDTVDQIAENSLALRLGNQELAAYIVRDMTRQVEHAAGRVRSDARISVTLTPWAGGPDSLYMTSVRCSHLTEAPLGEPQKFSCVPERAQYEKLLRDPQTIEAWSFEPTHHLAAETPDVFTLLRYDINGTSIPITRTALSGQQTYTVNPPIDVAPQGQPYRVTYTYQGLIDRADHGLHLDIDTITDGLVVDFSHYDAEISHVEPLLYFPGFDPAHVERSTTGEALNIITTRVDGWIMPVAGLSFIWTPTNKSSS